MPGDLVDPGHLRRRGRLASRASGYSLADLHIGGAAADATARAPSTRPAGWGCSSPAPATSGNYTPRATPVTHHRRRRRHGVRLLRLGEHDDPDAAEHQPDHDRHDRPTARRSVGLGRRGGNRWAARLGGHDRAAAAQLGSGGTTGTGGRGRWRGRGWKRRRGRPGRQGRLGRSTGGAGGDRRKGGGRKPQARAAPSSARATSTRTAGNPCVAAHSTVRALFGAYSGKLYQVRNAAGTTKDILHADAGRLRRRRARKTRSVPARTCVITVVYDQSGKGNDLWYQGSTMVPGSTSSQPVEGDQRIADAQRSQGLLALHQPRQQLLGRRLEVRASPLGSGSRRAVHGDQRQALEQRVLLRLRKQRDRSKGGRLPAPWTPSTSAALATLGHRERGAGPWVMADLEYGVFTAASAPATRTRTDPTQTSTYVTAILKNNGTTEFALRGGDATTGSLGHLLQGRPARNG